MKIVAYEPNKHLILLKNIVNSYEAEFSLITQKKPDEKGCFELDFDINDSTIEVFFAFLDDLPVGFVVVKNERDVAEICEFYIHPCFRKKRNGDKFASSIFRMYKKKWIVKQLPNAKKAYSFWSNVISKYTNNDYKDGTMLDEYWGHVTFQEFKIE